MAKFTIPNLCGASPELNLASTKIADLENEITSKLDAVASEAAAAFDSALADVKDGLDGLALVGICGGFLLFDGLAVLAAWAGLLYGVWTIVQPEK